MPNDESGAGGAAPPSVPDVRSVLRLWVRPEMDRPVEERPQVVLVAGRGIEGDHGIGGRRHLTLLFADDWSIAESRLGRTVDPSARRANVLLSGRGGPHLVGRRLWIGGLVLDVKGVTEPCPVMERGARGLQAALDTDALAGVWGRLSSASAAAASASASVAEPQRTTLRVGDPVTIRP